IALFALLIFAQTGRADPLDTWSVSNPLPTGRWNGIAYGNGQFVVVGQSADGEGMIVTSSDSMNWVPRLVIPRNGDGLGIVLFDIVYGNGLFVAAGGVDGIIGLGRALFTSFDGVTWIQRVFSGCCGGAFLD